jgi:uncharacterized phage-associated protein
VGLVFLLNNLGYVRWDVWFRILSLWPVILIAVGIELIFKRTRLSFLTLLSPLLFMAAILGPTYFQSVELTGIYRSIGTYQYDEDMDTSVMKVTAIVQLRAGNLKVSSEARQLVSAKLDFWKRKPITSSEYSGFDSSTTIEIRDKEREWKGWSWRAWGAKDWEIQLTNRVPVDLRIYAKATDAELDLSDLRVTNLNLETKAGNFDIKLGDMVDQMNGTIESDASRLHLLIPEDVGLRIENHSRLTSTSFSDLSILKYDNVYETSNFEQAPRKVTLSLEGSVTRLVVKSYQNLQRI